MRRSHTVKGTMLDDDLAGDISKVDKYSLNWITVPERIFDEFIHQERKLNQFLMPGRM